MSKDVIDRNIIRQYLLGELTQDEQSALIEERLLLDDDFFEEFELVKEDLIDQYVGGELSEGERESFEQEFLTTQERQESLRNAQALARYAKKEARGAARATEKKTLINTDGADARSRWAWFPAALAWRVAAGVLLVAGVAFGIWRVFIYQSDVERGLLALQATHRLQRPTEARISVLNYAPLPNTRGGGADEVVDPISHARAERLLLDAVNDDPGPESFHALGQFYLGERKFDRAIGLFEEAIKADPRNARLRSDLGAALLEMGKTQSSDDQGKGIAAFAKSLEQLNLALASDGSLLEALFNRALACEYLKLYPQAEEAWHKYLENDAQSPWAEEARRHLESLEERKTRSSRKGRQPLAEFLSAYDSRDDEAAWLVVSRNRNVTGGLVVNSLVTAHLDSMAASHEDEARKQLEALLYVGELEVRRADDHFAQNLSKFYQSASPEQKQMLAQAQRLLKSGHEQLLQFKATAALEFYDRAKRMFEQAGDVYEAQYVEYPTAHALLLKGESERSLARFEALARACEEGRYRWLHAQTLNGLAIAKTTLNNYSSAIDSSKRSLEISKRIGDIDGVIKTKVQLAQEYFTLGNYDKALGLNQQALSLALEFSSDPLQLWRGYFTIAMPLERLGLSAAAVEFQKEALRRAISMDAPQLICRSYINLGLIYGVRSDYKEALRNIQLAFELGKTLPDESVRMESLAYSSLQLGHIYRLAGSLAEAAANYEQAIRLYKDLDYQAFNYVAQKGKLLTCLARGDCATAEHEIETTFSLFERFRSKILEESNRDVFFDTEQDICDLATDFAYSKKRDEGAAFEVTERCRARSLLDLTNEGTQARKGISELDIHFKNVSRPLGLAEIRARMPAQAQILQFTVLKDKVIAWLITRERILSYQRDIPQQELNERVRSYVQLVSSLRAGEEGRMASEARALYELLIGPAEADINKGKQLCIIPDKILNYLPYDALVSPGSGKYLIEEYVLTFSPSSNLFVINSDIARTKGGAGSESLLSVGNPSFDRASLPELNDLPAAEAEARAIATYYHSPGFLTGADATERRVERAMRGADVIHLALHSLADEQSPLQSRLLFAKDAAGADDGVMHAYEIYNLDLPITRLVVLSACQTGVERYYGGEGMIGISRPFLAARVPLVVASLWPVDSDASARLMIAFHRRRKVEHLPTAEALRRAQLDMLGQSGGGYRHPYFWAGFITIGGHAEF
jgi:CHAT domain-containing protein/tetratricopeptide (TPR) repeat protein